MTAANGAQAYQNLRLPSDPVITGFETKDVRFPVSLLLSRPTAPHEPSARLTRLDIP